MESYTIGVIIVSIIAFLFVCFMTYCIYYTKNRDWGKKENKWN